MKAVARAFAMDPRVWRRHANPWSGWSRALTGLPLIALAIWSRVWLGWGALGAFALVCLWLWLNPRVFPEPRHFNSWMSRGVLGEMIWIEHGPELPGHHQRAARLLGWLSLPGVLVFGWGLWALWLDWVVLGGLLGALPKLWFIDRMVWIAQDWEQAHGPVW